MSIFSKKGDSICLHVHISFSLLLRLLSLKMTRFFFLFFTIVTITIIPVTSGKYIGVCCGVILRSHLLKYMTY